MLSAEGSYQAIKNDYKADIDGDLEVRPYVLFLNCYYTFGLIFGATEVS